MNPQWKAQCKSLQMRKEQCIKANVPLCLASFLQNPQSNANDSMLSFAPMEAHSVLHMCMVILAHKKDIKEAWKEMSTEF